MHGKRIALIFSAMAVLVVIVVVVLSWDRVREQWYLRRLTSTDESVRLFAAERLAELKSLEAIPSLQDLVRHNARESGYIGYPRGLVRSRTPNGIFLTPLAHCLYRIGARGSDAETGTGDAISRATEVAMSDAEQESHSALLAVYEAWRFPRVAVHQMSFEGVEEKKQPQLLQIEVF